MPRKKRPTDTSNSPNASDTKVLTPEVLDRLPRNPKKTLKTKAIEPIEVEEELSEDSDSNSDESSQSELDPEEITGQVPQFPMVSEPSDTEIAGEVKDVLPAYQDLLRQYIRDVSKYSLLSLEEEFALAIKLRDTGDLEAARRLVSANLRLVVKIAMEYRSAYQNVMDLIQEGNIGLMRAVSKFDPAKGAKLSYYASWWIRSYILKYILDNFRLVRVGTTQAQKKLFFHLMREKERLEAQGLVAGPKLLADKLNVREQDVVEMEQRLSGRGAEMSLNQPVGGGGGEDDTSTTHQDFLAAKEEESPDLVLANAELRRIIANHIEDFAKTLKEKEVAVFRERLAAEEPKTLQEVADQFGLTRERVRQIESKVIEKLREYYNKYIR
jgi:RNA polymerase sigma-32 factor